MKKLLLPCLVMLLLFAFRPKELTWVAIGDSITYLNEHQDETGNRITKGYMTRVTEKLTHIHYINKGYNGWTSIRIADSIDRLGLQKADIYSVFLGTNDWWQGRPLGTYSNYQNNTGTGTVYGAFRVIVNKLRSLNSAAKIILITPMQRGDFVYINDMKNNAHGSYKKKSGQTLEQFAVAIDSIARFENFALVDLYHQEKMSLKKLVKYKRVKNPYNGQYKNYAYPGFLDIPFNPDTDEYPYPAESIDMTYDGLHPSDKGYNLIAELLIRIMNKY